MYLQSYCSKLKLCDVSIKHRFRIFLALIVVFIAFIAWSSLSILDKNNLENNHIYEDFRTLHASQQVKTCLLEQYSLIKSIVFDPNSERISTYKMQYNAYQQQIDTMLNSLINRGIYQDTLLVLKKSITQWTILSREIITYKENDEAKNLKVVFENTLTFQKEYVIAYLDFLIREMFKKGNVDSYEVKKLHQQAHFGLIVFLLVLLMASAGSSFTTIYTIYKPLKNLIQGVREITNNNLELRLNIHRKDEIGELSDAIAQLQQRLIDRNNEIERSNAYSYWLKLGQTGLYEQMRGETNVHRLADKIITFLSQYIEAQAGVLYLYYKHPQQLKLTGTYAVSSQILPDLIKIGEGLIGQAALDRQARILNNLKDDYFKSSSSIVDLNLKNVLIVPFLYEDRVIGVLELASYKELSNKEFEFVQTISEDVAVVLKSTIIKKRSLKGKRKELGIKN